MTRNDYWNEYAKRLSKLEKKYAPKVYKALIQQVKDFTKGLREGRTYGGQTLWNEGIAKVLREMHIRGAISEGRIALIGLRSQYVTQKRLGTNEEWTAQIIEYLRYHNAKFVVSITETTTEYLIRQLEQGLADGLSLNEIAAKLDLEVPQIYLNRSFAIARTELNRAANLGTQLAAKDYEYETEKTWITAKDHRVRGREGSYSHIALDGKKIDTFDKFGNPNPFNNGEPITQPGDPNASPGNTINCRCTIAITGKRDANGRLIRKKPKTLIPGTANINNEIKPTQDVDGVDVENIKIESNVPSWYKNTNNINKAKNAYRQLKELGIPVESVAASSTDHGNSFYMKVKLNEQEYKIRISDHSVTNYSRLQEEIHLDPVTGSFSKADFSMIERAKYPDRYFKNETIDLIQEVLPKRDIQTYHTILEERVSKRTGKPVFLVQRERKIVQWVRKID